MGEVKTLGIDLAKTVFHLWGVDSRGQKTLQKRLSRNKLREFLANLPPCLVGMESCGGSNYWARQFESHGHTVRIMQAKFVKAYVKTNKNDWADAQAIVEAVQRPNMRFVPIKQRWQQGLQTIHRIREQLVREKTAISNEIRAYLLEEGIVIPIGMNQLEKRLPEILEDKEERLYPATKQQLGFRFEDFKRVSERVKEQDRILQKESKSSESCQRLEKIKGVGVVTSTAIISAMGHPSNFKNGRHFAAWLGVVPKHSGTGGKNIISSISKRGNKQIRTLLIEGSKSSLRTVANREDRLSRWALKKKEQRGYNKAAVALANKHARIIWALLAKNEEYKLHA